MNNFLNSQELPDSPSHYSNTKEKRDLISKVIQSKELPPNNSKENREFSDDLGSLENELNELENDETLKKITERIQERHSFEQKKLNVIRTIKPTEEMKKNIINPEKNIDKIENPIKKSLFAAENIKEIKKKPIIEEKKLENPNQKDKNMEIIETFGSNLDISEGLQDFINDTKENEKELSISPGKLEKPNDFVIARSKIEVSWLNSKTLDQYFLYILNAFLLMKCLEKLEAIKRDFQQEDFLEGKLENEVEKISGKMKKMLDLIEENEEILEKIKKKPAELMKFVNYLRKSFKITHYINSKNMVLDRNSYIHSLEKDFFMMKKGQRFNTIQQRIAKIPAFINFIEESMKKVAFLQKKKNKTEKKFNFPQKVYRFERFQQSNLSIYSSKSQEKLENLESNRSKQNSENFNKSMKSNEKFEVFARNSKAISWPNRRNLNFRVDLIYVERKSPVSLFFEKSEEALKIFNFMILKKLINERFDIKGFFHKYAMTFYLNLALKLTSGIRKLALKQKELPFSQIIKPNESRFQRIFDDSNEKNKENIIEKTIKKENILEMSKKEEFVMKFEKKPEDKVNLEPKNAVKFEINIDFKEKMRFLRNSAVLNTINSSFLGEFMSKWLEFAEKNRKNHTFSEKKLNLVVKKVEIPQKLCFYKPKVDISLETIKKASETLKEKSNKTKKNEKPMKVSSKTLDLKIESRINSLNKSFNILNFLDKSTNISSILASNDTIILWKPASEIKIPIFYEEKSEFWLIFEVYDEGGFSFLSNLAQNLTETTNPDNNANNSKEKFITHSIRANLTDFILETGSFIGKNTIFLALQPLFSKNNNENEILERILIEFELFSEEITENSREMRVFYDPIYKVPLKNGYLLTPKYLKNPEILAFFDKIAIIDFEEKFEIFKDFSDAKFVAKIRENLNKKIQEFSAKSYIKSCSNFQKIAKSLNEFNEIFEKIQISLLETGENSDYYIEFITGLAIKGFPNEIRLFLWLFQQKPRFLETARLSLIDYLKTGSGKNQEIANDLLKKTLEKPNLLTETAFFSLLEEIAKPDPCLQQNHQSLKADYLDFIENLQFFKPEKKKAFGFKIISICEFFFTRILNKPFIFSHELLLILSEIMLIFSTKYPFFPEESPLKPSENEETQKAQIFILFSLIISHHLSRYFLLTPIEKTKNYQKSALFLTPDFKGLKGDMVLFKEYFKEKLPEIYKLFELGSGTPIPLDYFFLKAYSSMLSNLNLRKDLLYRIWDILLSIDSFEILRKNTDFSLKSKSLNLEIAISENYKVYITAFLIISIKRTIKSHRKSRDFNDFMTKMKLLLDLIEDIDEFINEMLFERLEILDFLIKKSHVFLDFENQHINLQQKPSLFLRNARKTLGNIGFSLINLQTYLNQLYNVQIIDKEAIKASSFLHIFIHFLNIYHNTSSENVIILELFYEKSSFFFSLPNSDDRRISLDIYEKMKVNPRNKDAFLRIYESNEKMPEKIDSKFKSQLKLFKFATIGLRNLKKNVVFTGFYKLVNKEIGYNFAASEAFISILLEEDDIKEEKPHFSLINLTSKTINNKGPIVSNDGFRKISDFHEDYEEILTIPEDFIEKLLDPLRSAVRDVQDLKKKPINSSFLIDLIEYEKEDFLIDFQAFKLIFKNSELITQINESDFIQFYQSLLEINKESYKLANKLDFLLAVVINAKGSFSMKKTLFFAILQKENMVSLGRFKTFIRTLVNLLSINLQNNEVENLIESLLSSTRFPLDFSANIRKAQIQIRIAKSFSQNYDIKDILLLFIAKKHRFYKSKSAFFGLEDDFSQLKLLLEQNKTNNSKIKDFFNFIEKNRFDKDSKNELFLKIAYLSPKRLHETLEIRLNNDFQVILPENNERKNYEYRFYSDEKEGFLENIYDRNYVLKNPIMRLMNIHNAAFSLDFWDFSIDRETFYYLMEEIPFLGYYFHMIRSLNSIEFVSNYIEKSGFSLWIQIILEDEKLISILLEVNSELEFEAFSEIQRNYYVLANQWRQKFNPLSIPINKNASEYQKNSIIRNRIFDKEIKIMGISMFMPLESLILKIQKTLLETFLLKNNTDLDFWNKSSFYQWDFLRTYFYLHFPNKMHRIDVSLNDLYQIIQKNSQDLKMLVLEYKVKKPEDPLYQTFDAMLNYKEKALFNDFKQLALFRFADHSTEWLKARIISSYLLNPKEEFNQIINKKNEEIYSFFEVEFAIFPEETFLKKPSEVIFYEEIELWRIIKNHRKKGLSYMNYLNMNHKDNNKENEALEEFFPRKSFIEKKMEKNEEDLEELREDIKNLSGNVAKNEEFSNKNEKIERKNEKNQETPNKNQEISKKNQEISKRNQENQEISKKNDKNMIENNNFQDEMIKKTIENNNEVFETHEFYEEDEEEDESIEKNQRYFNPKEDFKLKLEEESMDEKGTLKVQTMEKKSKINERSSKKEEKTEKIEKNSEKIEKKTEKTKEKLQKNEKIIEKNEKIIEKKDKLLENRSFDNKDKNNKDLSNKERNTKAETNPNSLKIGKNPSKFNKSALLQVPLEQKDQRKSSIELELDEQNKKQEELAEKLVNFKYDDKAIKVTKVPNDSKKEKEENKEEQVDYEDSLDLDD